MLIPAWQDPAGAVPAAPQGDAINPGHVASPLPGGAAEVFRFFLNLPSWLQAAGAIVGALVALLVLAYLWRRRAEILTWIRTRERAVKLGLGAGAFVLAVGLAGAGFAGWDYVEHENGFCTGCHVMEKAWGAFAAKAGKHDTLGCHDCHQQSMYASLRQLYLWVAERPVEIAAHATIPDRVCEKCHADATGDALWQRVKTTAGHRVHLESDSSALRDVRCVTCHGLEVHAFVPSSRTCGQSGCHENLDIRLGGMAQQTSLHCNSCHQFTAEVPVLATLDSASGTLVPKNRQCLGCHEMQQMLVGFDPAKDPHTGTCGACHNPHTQETPRAAAQTCTTAACHSTWRAEPFHLGASHRRVNQQCTLCHQPHAARVDASDCTGCHTTVSTAPGNRVRAPLPFDTTRALRPTALHSGIRTEAPNASIPAELVTAGESDVGGIGWGVDAWPRDAPLFAGGAHTQAPPARDSFPHPRHRRLACLTCHLTTDPSRRLTFEQPRGCLICHHQRPATSDCAECHQAEELVRPLPATVTVTVRDHAPRVRRATFAHQAHDELRCTQCHVTPVTLAPSPAVAQCSDCHAEHHAERRDCAACHAGGVGGDLRPVHTPPNDAHRFCGTCHKLETVAHLVPARPFCLTCHEPQREHYPDRECTVCHLQTSPEAWRRQLGAGGRAG